MIVERETPYIIRNGVTRIRLSPLVIPKYLVTHLILLSILVGSNFVSPEGISLVMLLLVIVFPVAFGFKIPRGIWFAVWPIAVMMLLGLIGSFVTESSNREINDVIKDSWYFGKAILTVLFGYLVMWRIRDIRMVLRLFVLAAVIVSGLHLISIAMDPSVLREPIDLIRETMGVGYMISALGVIIILTTRNYQLNLLPFRSKLFLNSGLILCLLSVVISFSRTLWVCTFIFVMLLLYKSKSKKLGRLALAGLVVTVLLFSVSGLTSTLQSREDAFGSMMAKITSSIEEITISDYEGMAPINLHWRGFESYQAFQTYKSGTIFECFFGQGFGTNIDLGFFMPVEAINMRYIPILHNGYLYILVKTGFIGLVLYLYYLIFLFRYGHRSSLSDRPDVRCSGLLLMTASLAFFTTTYVISGMFNKNVLFPVTLLLGSLLCHIRNAGRGSFRPSRNHELITG